MQNAPVSSVVAARFRAALLFAVALIPVPSVVAAEGWILGNVESAEAWGCANQFEIVTQQRVDYYGDPPAWPRVGDVYPGRFVWKAVGSGSCTITLSITARPPIETEVAISTTDRLRCYYMEPGASSYTEVTDVASMDCQNPEGYGEVWDFGSRSLPNGSQFMMMFPLRSNATVSQVENGHGAQLAGDFSAYFSTSNGSTNPSPYVYVEVGPADTRPIGTTPAGGVRGDFGADARADLLWRNQATAETALWVMDGLTLASSGYLPAAPGNWTIRGIDDFDGDARADIVWQSTSGEVAVWMMNNQTIVASGSVTTVAPEWVLQGVGDFDGDRRADMLWRNSNTSQAVVWLMNGATVLSSASVASPSSDWSVQGVGDFNGDAKVDILWRNSSTNEAWAWLMNGAAIAATGYVASPPPIWVVQGVGDFSGEARADILWRNTATGEAVVWTMNGTSIEGTSYIATPPSVWSVRAVGDFNGDARADMMWRNTSTGENVIWLMNGLSISSTGYLPTISDQNWTVAGPR